MTDELDNILKNFALAMYSNIESWQPDVDQLSDDDNNAIKEARQAIQAIIDQARIEEIQLFHKFRIEQEVYSGVLMKYEDNRIATLTEQGEKK